MFGQMNDRGYLFCEGDGHATMQAQLESARREINTLLEERILNTDPTALADYFFEKYKANVPALDRENLVAEQHERNVTVYDRFDRREFQVPGVAFDFELPFVGDSVIFKVQPNTFSSNPPRAEVRGSSLFFTISGRALDAEKVKQDVDSLIASIEQYLGWHQAMWGGFEAQLKQAIDQAIGDRRDRLLKQKGSAAALAGLGIKLKEKPGDARTFVPPAIKQVITPKLPPMRPAQAPESTLDKAQYETILGLIRDAGHSIEQSSSRTRELDEEALRDIFLVPLNAHFGSATGETFNFGGKTDILIKYEGQNLFVAEFKFWGGEKLYTETIDQLLSYLTWRDTKAAIIVFNRNLGFSSVVTKITEATSTHPKFVSGPKKLDETSSQFVFSLPNDPDRHVTVSVLCFDLGPKS
jgi:hypothetical protein